MRPNWSKPFLSPRTGGLSQQTHLGGMTMKVNDKIIVTYEKAHEHNINKNMHLQYISP